MGTPFNTSDLSCQKGDNWLFFLKKKKNSVGIFYLQFLANYKCMLDVGVAENPVNYQSLVN